MGIQMVATLTMIRTYTLQPILVDVETLNMYYPEVSLVDDLELDIWLRKQLMAAFQGDEGVTLHSVTFNNIGQILVEVKYDSAEGPLAEEDEYCEDVLEHPDPTRDALISWNGRYYAVQTNILTGPSPSWN